MRNNAPVEHCVAEAFIFSGEDSRFYKRGIDQYPARLSGGFQSPTEIKASGGSQPCAEEGAAAPRTSRQERRGVLESSLQDCTHIEDNFLFTRIFHD